MKYDKYLISEAKMSQPKLNKAFMKKLPDEARNRLVMGIWQYTNPETIIGGKLFRTKGNVSFTEELIDRLNLPSYEAIAGFEVKVAEKIIRSFKLDKEWDFDKKTNAFLHKDKHNGYK